jgi:hypothetical protein
MRKKTLPIAVYIGLLVTLVTRKSTTWKTQEILTHVSGARRGQHALERKETRADGCPSDPNPARLARRLGFSDALYDGQHRGHAAALRAGTAVYEKVYGDAPAKPVGAGYGQMSPAVHQDYVEPTPDEMQEMAARATSQALEREDVPAEHADHLGKVAASIGLEPHVMAEIGRGPPLWQWHDGRECHDRAGRRGAAAGQPDPQAVRQAAGGLPVKSPAPRFRASS